MRSSRPVGLATGNSIEFFLVETVHRLEVVHEATTGGWNTARTFLKLKKCLRGDALKSYKKLVRDNYPNPADKTNENCKELVRLIPTNLENRPYPGNKIRQYMMNKTKYMNYRHLDGHRYNPTDLLRRLHQLRELEIRLEHSMLEVTLTSIEFLHRVWNAFPKVTQDWLTNDQKIDPFEPQQFFGCE